MRLKTLLTLALALISGPLLGLSAADAHHDPAHRIETDRYSQTRYIWLDKFKMCAQVRISGYVRADVTFTAIEGGAYATIARPRVINPQMSMTLRKSCAADAPLKTWHDANYVRYSNFFYGYTCSYNPSFSVGAPWSVSVGVTPDCGDERIARFGESNSRARGAYKYAWYTDGYALGWSQRKTNTQPTTLKLCSSTSGYLKFKDDVGDVRKTQYVKVSFNDVCVRYSYFD